MRSKLKLRTKIEKKRIGKKGKHFAMDRQIDYRCCAGYTGGMVGNKWLSRVIQLHEKCKNLGEENRTK